MMSSGARRLLRTTSTVTHPFPGLARSFASSLTTKMLRGTVRTERGGRLVPLDPLLEQTGSYCCSIETPSGHESSIKYDPYRKDMEEAIRDIYQQASPPDLRPKLAQRAHDWIVKLHVEMKRAGHCQINHTQQLRYGLNGRGLHHVRSWLVDAIKSDRPRIRDPSPKIKSIWSHWYLKVDVDGYRLDGDVPLRYGIHVEIEWELPGPKRQVSKIVKREYGGYVSYVFHCQTLYRKAAMEESQTEPLSDPSTTSVSVSEMSSRVKDFLGGSNRTGRLANKLSEYLHPSVEDCQSSKASQLIDRAAFMLGEIAYECESSQASCHSSTQAGGLLRLFRSQRNILRAEIETIKEHRGDRFGRTNRPTERRPRWWRKSNQSAAQHKVDMQEYRARDRNGDCYNDVDDKRSNTQGSVMGTASSEVDIDRTSRAEDETDDVLTQLSGLDAVNEPIRLLKRQMEEDMDQDIQNQLDRRYSVLVAERNRLIAELLKRGVSQKRVYATNPPRAPSIRDAVTAETGDMIHSCWSRSSGSHALSAYPTVAGSMSSNYPIGSAF